MIYSWGSFLIGLGTGILVTASAFEGRDWWRRRKIRQRWGRLPADTSDIPEVGEDWFRKARFQRRRPTPKGEIE